jgi:Tol biopolymer transport system component
MRHISRYRLLPLITVQEDRLSSWKAIAAYVKRDITTVQRWERREGMPVHRHLHDKRGSVYAFRAELDAWLKERSPQLAPEAVKRSTSRLLPVALLTVLTLVAGAGWWWMQRGDPALDPLLDSRAVALTDFDGQEQAATISRDGRFVAFLSDRDGQVDVWVSQLGTGEFRNLTQGKVPELLNPEVRTLAFTPDGSLLTFWTRAPDPASGSAAVHLWAVPTLGGEPRPYRHGAVEIDWSADARRSVFHTTEPGDPTFLVEGESGSARRLQVAPRGVHSHFQLWSPDGAFIYFTQGVPPDEMDLWRMKSDGTGSERLTFHDSRVVYPAFMDPRTVLYLAASEDGAGPWLYAFDVERRTSRRVSFGVEQYSSLAASADGRRLVATIENARTSLWRVPITDGIVGESAASRIDVRTIGGSAPRTGPDYLLYVSPKGTGYALWKFARGAASELWSAPQARPLGGAAISPDGKQVAIVDENREGRRLRVMGTDGSAPRVLAESLEPGGAPSWSPDGTSLTVSAVVNGRSRRLFRVPLDGTAPVQLFDADARYPLWSGDGEFLVFADADVGPSFTVKAVKADGTPHPLPPITLPRASRRFAFVPGRRALVILEGEMRHVNFWYVDLESGDRRQLTDFGHEYAIRDFDITAAGEIVFDRLRDNSDIALIELSSN